MAGGSNPESNKNVRQFLGNNLSGLGLSHLLILEKQVEESLRNVRLKKEQMMNDQIQEMNKKRCITNNENMELHQKINIISEENIKLKKETGHTSSEILNSTNTPEVPDAASLELRQPLSKELEELDEPTMELDFINYYTTDSIKIVGNTETSGTITDGDLVVNM